MRLAIFGLTVSSTWGNGHATLWRGLIGALAALGHRVTFLERDVPYYAVHRDVHALPDGVKLLPFGPAVPSSGVRDGAGGRDATAARMTKHT